MTKRMLIDATHLEETRVAVVSGNRLDEYDYETLVRKQLKGNIYLVKVTRVEPSLQAAFVDFGGNRHGFLPFPEIHPDYYRIPIADREALIAEERALAAEQAAREDEEDAAELAAQGQSLEDIDLEDDEEDDEEEAAAAAEAPEPPPIATASLAAEIAQEAITAEADEDDEEEEDEPIAEEAEEEDEEEEHALAAAPESDAVPAAAEAEDDEEEEEPAEKELEVVGGDVVETPVFRSSIKRRYKIQEVIKRNQIMLIQISKEERGNKGAAVTSYISLPGRYCVLMPNSPRGGGVSRKVSNAKDRQRLKKILQELNVPEGMSVILRTAGVSRTKAEIKRDLDYLLRLWDQIRELTLKSTAPALIYEEGNLIKRAIRDLYRREIDEVHVSGKVGYETARDFMNTLMPSHTKRIHLYEDQTMPLFFRYQVESQIDEIHSPTVHLKSGGYIVINPTEAMVSIDVNSGRATKGRHIEETALKTNLEASDEIARQLRLRDQGGLIVIDFIDMEDKRNNRIVERRLRDAMQHDRARIQLGRISAFGLLELSRQRLHPSLVETNFEVCRHCGGSGLVRTVETTAVRVLRAIEEEGLKGRASEIKVSVPPEIALYIFNNKREMLSNIESRYSIRIFIHADDELLKPNYALDVVKPAGAPRDNRPARPAPVQTVDMSDLPALTGDDISDDSTVSEDESEEDGYQRREGRNHSHNRDRDHDHGGDDGGRGRRRGRRGGRRRGGRNRHGGRESGRHEGDEGNYQQHGGGQDDSVPHEGGHDHAPDDHDAGHAHGGETREHGHRQHGGQHGEGGDRESGGRRRRRRGGRNRNRGDREGGDDNRHQRQQNGAATEGAAPSDSQPRYEEPSVSIPEPANMEHGGSHDDHDGDPGKARKGWWKRLTE